MNNSDDDRFPASLANAMADTLSDPDEIAEALADFPDEVAEALACFCAAVDQHRNSPAMLAVVALAFRVQIEEIATPYVMELASERLEEVDASKESSE